MEDTPAALRILESKALAQADAVKVARESLKIATNQYADMVSDLAVITAQPTACSNERDAISILGNRRTDCVSLVNALGGDCSDANLVSSG